MNPVFAQAIEAYRAALPPGQLLEFPLTPLDRLGIPVQALTLFPSAGDTGAALSWPLCEGIGYGETPEAARVGAYGELTEEVSSSAALPRLPRLPARTVKCSRNEVRAESLTQLLFVSKRAAPTCRK